MSALIEMCRRARDRAGAPARGLLTVVDYMRPGYAPAQPYVCDDNDHIVVRLYRRQRTAIEAKRLAPCPRRRCTGLLFATTWEREGHMLRAVLRQAAEVITCRDGLELIRAKSSGAPGRGGAAVNDDDLGSQTS